MKKYVITSLATLLLALGGMCQNPVILASVGQVKADSIQASLEHLQAFGTRYALAENRRDVATWIMNKFIQYGYIDVMLDSFEWKVAFPGIGDTTIWHYNVVCTMAGASAPGEVVVVGGHYDSFSNAPFTLAPGADDNGSAVAATLEVARVLKLMNVQPESTLRFILFAAEEIGYIGSKYQVEKSTETNEDIRMMFNVDMIASNPDTLDNVYLFRYKNVESAFNMASEVFQQYTGLSVLPGPVEMEYRSDSYTYWLDGFPATWAFEYEFCPYYHTELDIVSNCNLEYCAEITRGVLATIMEMQFKPYPWGVSASSTADNIKIKWKATGIGPLNGYNIYRSENDSTDFLPVNTTLVTDTFFVDQDIEARKDYYYYVTLVNDSLEESVASNTVHGARFGFTDTLLVVACLKGEQSTPDSIRQFYDAVLDSIPYRWYEMNRLNPLTLANLSQYQNSLWIINSFDYDPITSMNELDLRTFFENHGNMMFAGFSFSRFMMGNIGFPWDFSVSSIPSAYFKADSAFKKINSLMYQAYPDAEGYDTLRVDPDKTNKPGFPGELYNLEVYVPAPDGTPVYRFDSHYDPGTTQGSQQDKITGLEYMGDDFKTILLSFPLFYLDTADAERLMNYVMKFKFGHPTYASRITNYELRITNYPNPFTSSTTFSYTLDEPDEVTIQIFNSLGQIVTTLSPGFQGKGMQQLLWNTGDFPAGIYYYRIIAGEMQGNGEMVKW